MAQTASERRAAQRQLAKEIKSGTYKPSKIGAKARDAAKDYRAEKTQIVNMIREYKNREYGSHPRFNQKRSDKSARVNPQTGKDWTIGELREIRRDINIAIAEQLDYAGLHDLDHDYDDSPFFYH
jgi:hypothetical protein